MTTIERLQAWYVNQCDGDWEHCYGIEIGTLDNPGWHIKIIFTETSLEKTPFAGIVRENSEHDWLHAKRTESAFEAACGPNNLEDALTTFCDWAEAQSKEL
jgi:hypothetical protein